MRPSVPTRTAGEHPLPGGRVFLLSITLALAACGGPAAVAPGSAPPPSGTPAVASTSGFPPIPTNGGPAATGVILPTYFVTILESRYGGLTVLTTPGSSCKLTVAMPDGTVRADPELQTARVTDAAGRATFAYPATAAAAGVGIQTVACELGGQREQAQTKFEVK